MNQNDHLSEAELRRRLAEAEAALAALRSGKADTLIGDAGPLLFQLKSAVEERERAEAALRESEARFRRLFENSLVGIYRTTPDGRILLANPTLVKMLRYPSFEALAQLNLEKDGFPAESPRRLFKEAIERDGAVRGLESAWICADGTTIYVRESAQAVRGPDGSIEYYEGVVEDITEQRRLEEQLRQAQKMEVIGRLAGGVAHDFNNILTVILGHSDLLLKAMAVREPLRQHVEELRAAGQRAAALTRQLLAFSRKQTLQPQVLNLNDLIANLSKMLRRLIGEDILLTTTFDPALGQVKVDPGQIEQVITNLAVNARDAMPEGGTLTLQTANAELDAAYASQHLEVTPGRYVLLSVTDTGTGMSEEVQAHLFEPFFTTKGVGKGTGLGLATVFGIVKQSGGHITVHSELGHGTTFNIYLPRTEEAAAAEAVPAQAPVELPRGTETILLVEDERQVRHLAQAALERCGYSVLAAANGTEALQLAREHKGKLDLLVTDLIMPGINGHMLARSLQSRHPGLKFLFMSGYTDASLLPREFLAEGAAFLQKPFLMELLVRKVRAALDASPASPARPEPPL